MNNQIIEALRIEIKSLDQALKDGRLREALAIVAVILIDVKKLIN